MEPKYQSAHTKSADFFGFKGCAKTTAVGRLS